MAHPHNEPGKSYDVDDRRRAAALAACDGLPTEWLERGFVKELYGFMGTMALADRMLDRRDGHVLYPERMWQEWVRNTIDRLNDIATLRN